MKHLLTSNTSHTISFIPRFEPVGDLVLEVTKEGVGDEYTVNNTYNYSNGIAFVTFDLEGIEQERFSIKMLHDENVIYRGKLFFTEQEPQDFKLTKYTYINV